MSDFEFCPECEGPVVGFGSDQRCTECGITFSEMRDLAGDDIFDGLNGDDVIGTDGDFSGSDDSDSW
jgi:hypothetical protein